MRVPKGMTAQLLSNPGDAPAIDAFVRGSPDHTIYHRPSYIEFARGQNGAADLVLLSRNGQPLVAIPFHPDRWRVSTGYAGVCLPATASEGPLRRSVTALAEFQRQNPRLRLYSVQSAQAPAADDEIRQGVLGWLFDRLQARKEPLHTRLLRLPALALEDEPVPASVTLDDSHATLMQGYDPALRNKIRQASRRGVTAQIVIPCDEAQAADVYREFAAIHDPSWRRTGMVPHTLDYLLGLEGAVRAAGGQDVVVLGLDATGRAVAAVNCHRYGERAVYWNGCSLTEGLELRANPFCLHAAIYVMQRMGVRIFELGRFHADETDPKELSVTSYKAQFRGDIQRVLNFELGAPRVDLRAAARRARSAVRVWRRNREHDATEAQA